MKVFRLIALFILVSTSLSAAHISSASISYKCLGNENYEFELIIYRDCDGGGAQFDNPVRIGVYSGDDYVTEASIEITSQENVVVESYLDCSLSPESYCIEKASYIFEFNLPTQSENYKVFYTRCCWSSSIANLLDPNMTGITVVSEISPLAQLACNSQEAYSFSLSTPLCSNVPYELSLPLFDSEGDSLVYSMCLPYKGGGSAGATTPGSADACDGVTPAPLNCPPTYEPVELLPQYTADNPFPTVDGFDIDSINGTISFTPTIQGSYLFGLCVEEYRNGVLLSSQILNLAKWDEIVSSTEDYVEEYDLRINSVSATRIEFVSNINISKDVKIEIFDRQGKIIRSSTRINSNLIEINCQQLSSGLYFVNFWRSGILQTVKVLVP